MSLITAKQIQDAYTHYHDPGKWRLYFQQWEFDIMNTLLTKATQGFRTHESLRRDNTVPDEAVDEFAVWFWSRHPDMFQSDNRYCVSAFGGSHGCHNFTLITPEKALMSATKEE